MKFYVRNRDSGNLEKSYPEVKMVIEMLYTDEHKESIKALQVELDRLLKDLGLQIVDHTIRTYTTGKKILNYRKSEFCSKE